MLKTGFVLSGMLLAALGLAQKMDPFDAHAADYRLLLSKRVQEDVKITTAQRMKLNEIKDQKNKVARPYLEQLQKEGRNQQELAHDQKYLAILMDLRLSILAQLSPVQLKRLRELSLQAVGLGGVMDVIVSTKIGMSSAQLSKARDIYGDGVKREQAIVNAINQTIRDKYKNTHVKTRQEAEALNTRMHQERDQAIKTKKPELDKIEAQTKKALRAVLTNKQLNAYQALQGKTFIPG